MVPVVEFINKSDSIAEKFGSASEEKSGAVKLSDTAWIRLVMQTMMKGQEGFKDGDRYFDRTDKKVVDGDSGVKFSAYTTYFTSSGNDKNEAYQGYSFTGFNDDNKAVSVTGVLYHLYFTSNFCLTYSSDTWVGILKDSDSKDKPIGNIKVEGVYPGEIQVFGKNNVAADFNSDKFKSLVEPNGGEIGIILAGDFPDWKNHMPEELTTDSWGFFTFESTTANTSTAYSIKRSGQSSFTNYNFSQVGALQ